MRKMWNKARNLGTAAVVRTKAAISNNKAEGFVDNTVSILICVVCSLTSYTKAIEG